MKIFHGILIHISNVLSIVFITYFILDRYNPMMKFIDNGLSKILLLVFGIVTLVANMISFWKCFLSDRQKKKRTGAIPAQSGGRETIFGKEIEEI